jgi:lysylphosphatidylglycerol synthetase-like protein (DUF2156 family)
MELMRSPSMLEANQIHETRQMRSSDTRKLGFLVAGVLLGMLVNVLATGFGASRAVAFGVSAAMVLASLGLALLSPGPVRPAMTEAQRRQRTRSIAIAMMLVAFCGLFYAATIVRIGGSMKSRPATPPQGAADVPAPRQ